MAYPHAEEAAEMDTRTGSRSPKNLAARAGRWSAQHRKTAIFGWLAFVVVTIALGSAMGTRTISDADRGTGESGRADAAIMKAFPKDASESVLVQSRTATVADPAFRAAVRDVTAGVSKGTDADQVKSPLDPKNAGQVSPDRHSALVEFEIRGDHDHAEEVVGSSQAAVARAQAAHPELRIEQFGDASAGKALSKSFEDDFKQAETLSLPITLLILVVAFGALVAAGLPLLLALSAVGATIGLVGVVSHIVPVDESISSVILLIGLAVGVDYSMFYLRREREERAQGRTPREALERAAATSGRAVLISGLTVMVAMAGMYFTGYSGFSSFATGTMLVVAVAMIGSLTVLPALLASLGDRVEKGRVPFIGRRARAGGESRVWSAILDRVLRRPLVSALVSGALLVALAIPAFSLQTALPGLDSYPRDLKVMQTFDRIQKAFPGSPTPAGVVVQANDVTAPAVQTQIAKLRERALATGKLHEPVAVEVSEDHSTAVVSFAIDGDGTNAKSDASLAALRGDAVPATVGSLPDVETGVAGVTAGTKDFNDLMGKRAPLVFAFVLSLAFLLMLVTFRSIVIALKAIVLNLLSVGAAYGVLVLVFQDGFAKDLLGFDSTGAITSWLPLFLFVVLFGLSMDYHVFILSRIREAVDRGMSTDNAIAHGIKTTAGVVTSAALVMVGVFAVFATLSAIEFKQMGVGLAAAVLIDATLVRAVLLPATMKLLGKWNWYLPKRLDWLPKVAHEPAIEPAHG
jgi:RND superfamily putative drug exporter